MRILVTGGAGFIGSHLLQHLVMRYPDYKIVCADSLTYAADYALIADLEGYANYTFIKLDITELSAVKYLFKSHRFTHVIHLAAESHVDNSIKDPLAFAKTNVLGTLNLFEGARASNKNQACFIIFLLMKFLVV